VPHVFLLTVGARSTYPAANEDISLQRSRVREDVSHGSKHMIPTEKIPVGAVILLCALASIGCAARKVTVTLDPAQARPSPIPDDFAGLSIEMHGVRDDFKEPRGHWLSPDNAPYIAMLKGLGIRSLRVGGNTTERTTPEHAYPDDEDGARVSDFANAIQARLIWNVPVHDKYDPAFFSSYAARLTQYQHQKGYTFRTIFQIGNEPDLFKVDPPTYQGRFDAYADALEAAVGPDVQYAGPSCASNRTYSAQLVESPRYEGPRRRHIAYVTHHSYPFGGASSYASAAAAIEKMLGRNAGKYQAFYDSWASHARAHGFAPRLEETNSIYQGGMKGASDSFAAALWALDYLSFFAHDTELAGLNFHVANKASAYNPIEPVGLASSYTLKGVGYGLLAYAQTGAGRPVPRTITNPTNVNLTAYARQHDDATATLVLINLSHGGTGADATVAVHPGRTYRRASVMYLRAPNNDAAATTGITLGGAAMSESGVWGGTFTKALTPSPSGRFTVSVPRTQAAIVRFF
jgi:hypothetical protein